MQVYRIVGYASYCIVGLTVLSSYGQKDLTDFRVGHVEIATIDKGLLLVQRTQVLEEILVPLVDAILKTRQTPA